MKRRKYCLALGTAGITGLAGCVGGNNDDDGTDNGDDGYIRPDDDPDNIPAFECDKDGFVPHWPGYNEDRLHWGDSNGDSLRVNALEFEYGDTVEIKFRVDEERTDHTGFNFEIYTETGWRDVRGADQDVLDEIGWDDEVNDTDIEWTIELTEDGIIEESWFSDDLEVCPDLVSARYRFVYFGVIGERAGLAVAFDLEV